MGHPHSTIDQQHGPATASWDDHDDGMDSATALAWAICWMSYIVCGALLPVVLADRLGRPSAPPVLAAAAPARGISADRLPLPTIGPTPLAMPPGLPDPGSQDNGLAVALGSGLALGSRAALGSGSALGARPFDPLLQPLIASVGPAPRALRFTPPVPAATDPPGLGTPLTNLPGSILLGGPLSLASIHEKPMVPAARIETALRASASNPLTGLPRHWRQDMQALVGGEANLLPAQVVRLPAPHLRRPEEIPLAVRADGQAETNVEPSGPQSRRLIERWAGQQNAIPAGQVQPVVVVLEPLSSSDAEAQSVPSVHAPLRQDANQP